MSLSWPWALAALVIVPLLLVYRWWANRRRKRAALRVSSVALIRAALPGRSQWRRRIPVILFLAGLLALGGALTRPQASLAVPSNESTIMLALDVSGSMCATDVAPNRLTAATEAARTFVEDQDGRTRVSTHHKRRARGLEDSLPGAPRTRLPAARAVRAGRFVLGRAHHTRIDYGRPIVNYVPGRIGCYRANVRFTVTTLRVQSGWYDEDWRVLRAQMSASFSFRHMGPRLASRLAERQIEKVCEFLAAFS